MTLLRRCELNMEPTWMTLQVDKSKRDKTANKVLFHLSFKMFISSFGQFLWEYPQEFSKIRYSRQNSRHLFDLYLNETS